MRLTDKDKFIRALDFLIYELHYPYDPPPFNDWTEEQKETADWFIMHIRNMMKHAQETKAIPIEQLLSILPKYDDYIHTKTYPHNETMEGIYSKGHEEGWNACLKAIKEELDYWEKESGETTKKDN